MKNSFFVLVLIGLFGLQSCNHNVLYDKVYSFEDSSWGKKDTAIFELEIQDTLSNFEFIVTLRTSTRYLYSNLWTHIIISSPDNQASKVAQVIPLANPDGSWIGKVSGTLVESKLHFGSKTFPLKGKYTVKITNATQEEEIPYVEDIGLRIVRQ